MTPPAATSLPLHPPPYSAPGHFPVPPVPSLPEIPPLTPIPQMKPLDQMSLLSQINLLLSPKNPPNSPNTMSLLNSLNLLNLLNGSMTLPPGIPPLASLFPDVAKNLPLLASMMPNLKLNPNMNLLPMMNPNNLNRQKRPDSTRRPYTRRERIEAYKQEPVPGNLGPVPIGSPEIVVLEGPINKKPDPPPRQRMRKIKKELNPGYMREIKTEPLDDYQMPRNPQPFQPMQPLGSSTNPNFNSQFSVPGNLFAPPVMTPNQEAYLKLQKNFPIWRFDYFKCRVLKSHTHCMVRLHQARFEDEPGLAERIKKINQDFIKDKDNILSRVSLIDVEKMCTSVLQNCVYIGMVLGQKEKGMTKEEFGVFLKTQLNYDIFKPYYDHYHTIHLPPFRVLMAAINEVFLSMDLDGCDNYQKQQLINALQYDWTDPTNCPARLQNFSRAAKLPVPRIIKIFTEARRRLNILIMSRVYYWSVDNGLPTFYFY